MDQRHLESFSCLTLEPYLGIGQSTFPRKRFANEHWVNLNHMTKMPREVSAAVWLYNIFGQGNFIIRFGISSMVKAPTHC